MGFLFVIFLFVVVLSWACFSFWAASKMDETFDSGALGVITFGTLLFGVPVGIAFQISQGI